MSEPAPAVAIRDIMKRFLKKIEDEPENTGFVFNGCPICNFAVEMSPLDDGFRSRLDTIYGNWRQAIREALARGQEAGNIDPSVNPEEEATFLVAAMTGMSATGKVGRDLKLFRSCVRAAQGHVERLLAA